MLKVYSCITTAHDLRLVALAAFICVLASIAAIRLLRYARVSKGRMRGVWLGVSAISTGFGIRSFIKQVHSNQQAATIVRAVLGLGKGLGLPVIAEGVETNDELRFLQQESCDEVQGYLLGRPAAIESFRQYTHTDTNPQVSPVKRAVYS